MESSDQPFMMQGAATLNTGEEGSHWQGWNGANVKKLLSATMVLTLGVIGSAILPMPYAFATTGAVLGTFLAVIVAFCNVYTCWLLIRGAQYTGTRDYETYAYSIGGFWFRLFTEFSIAILMIGTIIGALIQCGEVGSAGLEFTFPHTAPAWLTYRGGLAIVVFFTLVFIFPLCMLKNMSMLDKAGAVATLVVWFLMFVVIIQSSRMGLPALKDGDFSKTNRGSISDVANAFSLFGFAFYLQAIMMPLLAEMPAGRTGAKITNSAAAITILGVAFFTYFFTGFFGAAAYGYTNTPDNILDAQWFGSSYVDAEGNTVTKGTAGQFVLNLLMTIYLAVSLPPIIYACCLPFDSWLGLVFRERYERLGFYMKKFITVVLVIGISLAVALAAPDQSGNVLTVTGATGVVLVSYLIPIISHFAILFGKAKYQRDSLDSSFRGGGVNAGSSVPGSPFTPADLSEDPSLKRSGTPSERNDDEERAAAASKGLGFAAGTPDAEGLALVSDPSYPRPLAHASAYDLPRPAAQAGQDGPSVGADGAASRSLHHPSMDIAAQRANLLATPNYVTPPTDAGGDDAVDLALPERTATMTTIGYFRVPRVYHAANMSRPVYIIIEILLPLLVLGIGILDGVATLVLLSNTINDD